MEKFPDIISKTSMAQKLDLLILFHRSLKLCSFFPIYFPSVLRLDISIGLALSSLTLYSVISISF